MIPGNANPLLLATAADGAAGAVQIDRSLRFDLSASSYLSRTPSSAGNRKTWTWSGWVKRSGLGNEVIFSAQGASTHTLFTFYASTTKFAVVPNAGSAGATFQSNALFRDTGAWYHFVIALDTTQSTSTDRFKVYVNGAELTWSSSSYPAQNEEWNINVAGAHNIGRATQVNSYLDGYLADIYFIDGSALDATSFGAYDDSGVWQAAAYNGTYGTNGFHILDFANESTVGHDSSGNENDWTANNISTTAGSGNDVLFDSPTNGTQSDTGAGGEVSGNYCTWNLLQNSSLANGNLDTAGTGNFYGTIQLPSSGKWYWEVTAASTSYIGIDTRGQSGTNYIHYNPDGQKQTASGTSSYGASFTTNDIIGVAVNMDDEQITWYKNNTSQGTVNFSVASLSNTDPLHPQIYQDSSATSSTNWGQREFSYDAPSGFKCLCTTNLPTPTIADGSTAFNAVIWTGDGTSDRNIPTGHSSDFVWLKRRDTTNNPSLTDIVRGVNVNLRSSTTGAETTDANSLTGFDSDGFEVGSDGAFNGNNGLFVAWSWDGGSSTVSNTDGSITSSVRANQTAGFSIVSYTGNNGSSGTVGHGLNAKPGMFIVKNRDTTGDDWIVYHESLGATKRIKLNSTNAADTNSSQFNDTEPTSSVFTVGSLQNINDSYDYIAYCFTPVAGFSAIGSVDTNGTTDNAFIYLGFRAKFIMFKRSNGTGNWVMWDTSRNTFNVMNKYLFANSNIAEGTDSQFDILSNGIKIRTAGFASGGTYLYLAFSENPFSSNGGLAR